MGNLAQLSCGTIGQCFFGGSNPLLGSSGNELGGIGKLVTLFLNAAFVLAGIILLIFFVMGGIGMIAGAGSNDPQKVESAKKSVTSALIGFIIVFTAYWIVKLIEGITGLQLL